MDQGVGRSVGGVKARLSTNWKPSVGLALNS